MSRATGDCFRRESFTLAIAEFPRPIFSSKMRTSSGLTISLAAWLISSGVLRCEVKLPPHFSDHMVLQRDMRVPIWGTADPGEAATVAFAEQQKSAIAGADGKWRIELDAMSASPQGRPLGVTGTKTNQPVRFNDVVVLSPEISAPTAVRHEWENYPEGCNLDNTAGLPTPPFSTDTYSPPVRSSPGLRRIADWKSMHPDWPQIPQLSAR